MDDFNPVTLFFILYESIGVWLFVLAAAALALLLGVVAAMVRLRRIGRPAGRPLAAALIGGLAVAILAFFLVPGWTLAGLDSLNGAVDYLFAALLALVPGAFAGALLFMLAARRCVARASRSAAIA